MNNLVAVCDNQWTVVWMPADAHNFHLSQRNHCCIEFSIQIVVTSLNIATNWLIVFCSMSDVKMK